MDSFSKKKEISNSEFFFNSNFAFLMILLSEILLKPNSKTFGKWKK